jgi:hypothetical protein
MTMKLFNIRSAQAIRRAPLLCLYCVFGIAPTALALDKVSLAVPVVAVQYMPIYLGVKERVFAEEGLAIEIHVMRTDLAIAGLDTGRLDYIAHGGAALRGATRGFPLKLIFALDDKAAFWLLTQPGIRDAASLKGKKIGISFPGDTPHLVLKRFLRKRGLDPDRDVIYVAGQISPIVRGWPRAFWTARSWRLPIRCWPKKKDFIRWLFLVRRFRTPQRSMGLSPAIKKSAPGRAKYGEWCGPR